MRLIPAVLGLLCFAADLRAADLCTAWSEGQTLGVLDHRLVPEASGLAASRVSPRLYHVNDSGGGPFLYSSGLDGADLERLRLDGVQSVWDSEALALASLADEPTLVVADIGDNKLRRRFVDLLAVREREIFAGRAVVSAHVRARYPDGPHNAEGLAAAPNGDLLLFTKSWAEDSREPAPARIYRLPASVWQAPPPDPVEMELVGEIDLPLLATRERAPFSDVVTDVSMAEDGTRFLVLTYGYAWEFAIDLSSGSIPPAESLERGRDYQLIRLAAMLGKETIAYLPGDRAFLYGKEYRPDSKPSELIRVDCTAAP